MTDTIKRIFVLGLVFAAAFAGVYAFRAWQGGHPIFGFGKKPDSQQFSPENATLATESPLLPSEVPGLARANDEMINLVKKVTPSVVSIDTKILKKKRLLDTLRNRVYERSDITQGLGSGVIASKEGHVITSHHVIDGHQEIRVTMKDGRNLPAIFVGSDPLSDIAVLRIKGQPGEVFTPLKFADSDQVEVGQLAIAVGSPFDLGTSVTTGRVSARNRSLSDGQRDMFQTDVPINPGNSGGPLLNHLGEIIGINASIYSTDRQNPSFGGISFSIPSNDVVRTMNHIFEKGRAIYGFLGIQARDLDQNLRNIFAYSGKGALIWDVTPGSPADLAGLKHYDIVAAFKGSGVESATALISSVQRSDIDEEVTISVWRGNETLNLQAIIAESDPFGLPNDVPRLASDDAIVQVVGIEVRDLPLSYRQRGYGGVMVTRLLDKSYGAQAGIKPGDILLEINGERIRNHEDYYLKIVAAAAVQETRLLVIRGNDKIIVTLKQVPRTPSD
ncbi:trypsin-like peptidase domain-containing protein [bacterium]|nr:trypsin-like peptidase domain-containing protein [bacterium]